MGKQATIKKARRVGEDIPDSLPLRTQRRVARAQQVKGRAVNVSPEPSDSTEPNE